MYKKKDFYTALQVEKLSSSEFAIISLTYLEQVANENNSPQLKQDINQLKSDLCSPNYLSSPNEIIDICNRYKSIIDTDMTNAMQKKIAQLTNDPNENHNRRFFETNLSKHLANNIQDPSVYKSIQPLATVMRNMHPSMKKKVPRTIRTPNDAIQTISTICQFNDNIEMGLKGDSKIYKFKDRQQKENIGTALSRNDGIMKSTTPNFYDETSDQDITNRVVDKFRVDEEKKGFSQTNAEIPFVNSVSGTTFTLAVLLNETIKNNTNSPTLEADVNNIVQAFMTIYVNMGFHSLGEMQRVLNEDHIQKIFLDNNISLDLSFPDQSVNASFKEAQQYTMTTCLKKATMEQLKREIGEAKPITPPAITQATPKPLAEELGLTKGQHKEYNNRPGNHYYVFKNDSDKLAAYNAIVDKYGADAVNISRQLNTIRIDEKILEDVKRPENLAPSAAATQAPPIASIQETASTPKANISQPTNMPEPSKNRPLAFMHQQAKVPSLTQVKESLNKGNRTRFPGREGKIYYVFQNKNETTDAFKKISDTFGEQAVRVARNPNTIEILQPNVLEKILQATSSAKSITKLEENQPGITASATKRRPT